MEFEQAVTLLSIAGLIVATFLIHRSVPASMWDKGIKDLRTNAKQTETPVDDVLVEVLTLLRGMQQAQETKPAETPAAIIPADNITTGITTKTVTTTTAADTAG